MEEGQVIRSDLGTPQEGCISPLPVNIYLGEFDRELARRELRFCRYADDVIIFVCTEKASNRVMASVSSQKHLYEVCILEKQEWMESKTGG